MTDVLDRRALNRSFLARQLLLERERMSVPDAVEHLVGMQAQSPAAPYFGLRARLQDFDPLSLSTLIAGRKAVRIALMRSTIHLVTARDCLRLRPLMQPAVESALTNYRKEIAGIDREGLLDFAARSLEDEPKTAVELERELATRWRKRDAHALAMAVRCWLPLVQVPPRGLWKERGPAAHTTAESWLGRPLSKGAKAGDVLIRYLRAFGPASVKDFQTWSGLSGVKEVLDRRRSKLRTFRDEHGTELFDVEDAPFPDPETPVQPIFLPEYDNALLSHAERSRIVAGEYRNRIFTKGALLVDGFAVGRWWIASRPKRRSDLVIENFEPIAKRHRSAVTEEAERILGWWAGEGAGTVQSV